MLYIKIIRKKFAIVQTKMYCYSNISLLKEQNLWNKIINIEISWYTVFVSFLSAKLDLINIFINLTIQY